MIRAALPRFIYHPDPVASGSIVESKAECRGCLQRRGWNYTGAVYAKDDLDECLCPWCIADGSAHAMFGAEFIEPPAVGDYGAWDSVPESVIDEVCHRTPSFNGWQQERWYTHCYDAAEFIGPVGALELGSYPPSARAAVADECGFEADELTDYMNRLDKVYGPTAYLFRCRVCGAWGGYSDIH
jgi:uncharacterized protein